MTVELVDGHAGTPHINSRDLAILHQGWRNAGSCVFPGYGGTPFNLTFSGSTANIGPGAGSIQGLDFYNDSVQSIPIQSGSGTHVIAAVYENNSGVESVSLKCYASESDMPSQSAQIVNGATVVAMPLWSITGSGVSYQRSRRYSMLSLGGGGGLAQDVSNEFTAIGLGWTCWWQAIKINDMIFMNLRAHKDSGNWRFASGYTTELMSMSPAVVPYWPNLMFVTYARGADIGHYDIPLIVYNEKSNPPHPNDICLDNVSGRDLTLSKNDAIHATLIWSLGEGATSNPDWHS